MARLGERDRQPTSPDAQLENRPLGPIGEGEIEVEVAGIVGQVQVVQARQCRRGRGVGPVERSVTIVRVDGQPSQRTVPPALRLTASALMASRAARLAAIEVVSAWS